MRALHWQETCNLVPASPNCSKFTMLTYLAYVDPGSGLMLVQILMAAFCGIALSLRKVRTWVKGLFVRNKDKPE